MSLARKPLGLEDVQGSKFKCRGENVPTIKSLYVCVCMCVYLFRCVYVFVRVRAYVCARVYVCVCLYMV